MFGVSVCVQSAGAALWSIWRRTTRAPRVGLLFIRAIHCSTSGEWGTAAELHTHTHTHMRVHTHTVCNQQLPASNTINRGGLQSWWLFSVLFLLSCRKRAAPAAPVFFWLTTRLTWNYSPPHFKTYQCHVVKITRRHHGTTKMQGCAEVSSRPSLDSVFKKLIYCNLLKWSSSVVCN